MAPITVGHRPLGVLPETRKIDERDTETCNINRDNFGLNDCAADNNMNELSTQRIFKKLKLEDSPPTHPVAGSLPPPSLLKTSSFYLDRRQNVPAKKRSVSFTFGNEANQDRLECRRRSSMCGGVAANGMNGLMVAALDGSVLLTQQLLEAGMDPSAVDKRGFDALMYAVRDGNLTIAELLLKSPKVNRNIRTKHGLTHIMYAAINGHASCIELLIRDLPEEKVIELIGMTDDGGFTPLMGAAQNGHIDAVKVLLKAGASLETKDRHGMTALFWAVTGNRLGVVTLLIASGANVNVRERKGKSPLLYTVVKQQTGMAKILLSNEAEVCERVRMYCLMDHAKQTNMKKKWEEDSKKLKKLSNAA